MKYFTQELREESGSGSYEKWTQTVKLYWEEKEKLRPFLSKKAQAFFFKAKRHDAVVLSVAIGNRTVGKYGLRNYVEIRIQPCSSNYIYPLRYNKIKRYQVSYSSEENVHCFDQDGPTTNVCEKGYLGYWLYDELSRTESGDFFHEIVLSENETVLIEFGSFNYSRQFVK